MIKKALLLAGVLALASAHSAFAATKIADYQFQNTLASSCCGAPALTDVGTGQGYATATVNGSPRTVRTFTANNGEQYHSGLANDGQYSIVVQFRFDTDNGYKKLLDFNAPLGGHSTDDRGLYIYNGRLNFYNVATGTTPIPTDNTFTQVTLTRDAVSKVVTGYVNGNQQFQFVDNDGLGIINAASRELSFFSDDTVQGGAESSSGQAARIRIYDGALLPSEVATLEGNETNLIDGHGTTKAANGKPNAFDIGVSHDGTGTVTYTGSGKTYNGDVTCVKVNGGSATLVSHQLGTTIYNRTFLRDGGASGDKLVNTLVDASKLSGKSVDKALACIDPPSATLDAAPALDGDPIQIRP